MITTLRAVLDRFPAILGTATGLLAAVLYLTARFLAVG